LKKTFDVVEDILVVLPRRRVGAGDFWREKQHGQRPYTDADAAHDEAQPPGAYPTRITLVKVRI